MKINPNTSILTTYTNINKQPKLSLLNHQSIRSVVVERYPIFSFQSVHISICLRTINQLILLVVCFQGLALLFMQLLFFFMFLYLHYILSLSSMFLCQILNLPSHLKVLMTWIHPTAHNRSLMLLGPVLEHFNLGFLGSHGPGHPGYHKRRINHLTDDFFSLFG
ncbi:hypothetical protein Hanom_Chr01g00071621 [Helianthus anomalus]